MADLTAQAEDPDSLLTLTCRLLRLRREHPILHAGDFEPYGATPDGTYAFRRVAADGRLTVVLNLTAAPRTIPGAGPGQVLIGTEREREGSPLDNDVQLQPNEALVIEGRR